MKLLVLLATFIFTFMACSSPKSTSDLSQENVEANRIERAVDLTDYLKRISGLQVRGSGPNASIKIRGVSNVRGSGEPLFLLDDNTLTNYGLLYSLVNIEDVKSVKVLKDASETSFYGSRGANGVVIVKTKGN